MLLKHDNKALKNAAYGNILTLGAGNSFYVVTDTVVVGDLNVLTDKVIYVIGNEDGIASRSTLLTTMLAGLHCHRSVDH